METIPRIEESNTYHAYLLRLWQVKYQGKFQWRASLEDPRTGERQMFATLEQCFAYLSDQYDCQGSCDPSEGEEPRR